MPNTLIVLEDLRAWNPYYPSELVVSFSDYLNLKESDLKNIRRVINLCPSAQYLGHGYYCSLLAEARGHRVMPTVNAINDLRTKRLYLTHLEDIKETRLPPPVSAKDKTIRFKSYFGYCEEASLRLMARRIFERLNFPILEIVLEYKESWVVKSLRTIAMETLKEADQTVFAESLERFSRQIWKRSRKGKTHRWEMAILVNPSEKFPPSNEGALHRMIKAGRKLGIDVDLIQSRDASRISSFDALFLRETTEINHPTYRLARRAELEGLVVIDDPDSILKCCNKVFLQDAFRRCRIPSLKSMIIRKDEPELIDSLETSFQYPLILKIPDGSFSRGVHKVGNRDELEARLQMLFMESTLLLAQEYFYTPFDWRIGMLNQKPLFANRYYMAKNHWQIYRHGKGRVEEGNFEALPTFEVPKPVLDAAIKAARAVGNGFYGIDLKQNGNAAYVIEVNDNPNVDHGVEDAFIGDELYMQLMGEFVRRLENRGRESG